MNKLLNMAASSVLNGPSIKILRSEESFDASVPEHSAVRCDRAAYLQHRVGLLVGEHVVFGQRTVELVMQLLGPSACLVHMRQAVSCVLIFYLSSTSSTS